MKNMLCIHIALLAKTGFYQNKVDGYVIPSYAYYLKFLIFTVQIEQHENIE